MKNIRKAICTILLATSAVALCAALSACDEKIPPHDTHVPVSYRTVKEATCTEGGEEEVVCQYGDVYTREIPALGHSYDGVVVLQEAKCEVEGVLRKTCSRCGDVKDEPIAALEHEWEPIPGKPETRPTCTEPGHRFVKCSVCGKEEEQDTKANGHSWVTFSVEEQETCTAPGRHVNRCTVCGATETVDVEALGHDFVSYTEVGRQRVVLSELTCTERGVEMAVCKRCDEESTIEFGTPAHDYGNPVLYTIDVAPTFETAGEKSIHCIVCDEKRDVQPIPKLDRNVKSVHEFRLVRSDGETRISRSAVKVSVLDAQGKVVEQGVTTNGTYRVELYPAAYKVRLSDLPTGYSAQTEYSFEDWMTVCKLPLDAELLGGNAPESARYSVGSVMYDFSYTTVDGDVVTLSALLREKKIVVLNFWATWCTPCREEFPALGRALGDMLDDVAVIAINSASTDNADAVRKYRDGDSSIKQAMEHFYLVKDTDLNLYSKFNTGYYPTTVVIDREGVICYIRAAATDEATFRSVFERYVQKETGAAISREVALPVRKED